MIHPSAIIDKKAQLGNNVSVGAFSIIGPDVVIGDDTVIEPHAVLKGPTVIGKGNHIFQFTSIGEDCQDKKYNGEPTRLEIGDNNVIRENVTIHRGTAQDNSLTKVGSDNLIMVGVHVAHDCVIGDGNIFANTCGIAGHVHIGDGVILGGMTAIHQFTQIGSFAMTAGCSMIIKDVPAYVMAGGHPASARGMNFEGMRRRGSDKDVIRQLRSAYKIVYRQGNTLEEAIAELEQLPKTDELNLFMTSLRNAKRGIVR